MILVLIFLISLIFAILVGFPISFALLLSGISMMFYLHFWDLQIIAQNLISGADSYTLLAIPFFIVAGEIMAHGGLSKRIVNLAMVFVGHYRGGLGYVVIFAAVLMASLSGSAVADTAALAAMLLPIMKRTGYPVDKSTGLMAAGGIIAPIIPPSIPLILLGVSGNISINQLFIAGIAPGILMGFTIIIIWIFQSRHLDLPTQEKADWHKKILSIKESFLAILLPVIIIGGIKTGTFTPTEAGVVAAVYALFISTFIYKEIGLNDIFTILTNATRSTAVIMFLVASATLVAWMISIAQLPDAVVSFLQPLMDTPKLLMLVIMVIVMLIGMVMDLNPTILVLTPILMPVIQSAGIDPIYFGVMFVMNCAIGLITPPVGNVLNVISSVGKIKFITAVKGVSPYILAYFILLGLFILFPEIITFPVSILYS